MTSHYKRKGLNQQQGKELEGIMGDCRLNYIDKHPMKCPVCGKMSAGYFPDGYKHPSRRVNGVASETTYCKLAK